MSRTLKLVVIFVDGATKACGGPLLRQLKKASHLLFEYRANVCGKMRTPSGIAAIEILSDPVRMSRADMPYTWWLFSLSGLITTPFSSSPANKPRLLE